MWIPPGRPRRARWRGGGGPSRISSTGRPGRLAVKLDLSATINLLGETLGEVLREQESLALFQTEEEIRTLAKGRRGGAEAAAPQLSQAVASLSSATARATASAFALYFDLVNLAEEGHRIQALRERERALDPAPIADSIGEAVSLLRERGVTSMQMAALLDELHVELVLTAHPTEAKRRTVLSTLQRISDTLRRLQRPDLLPREHAAELASLKAEVTTLWLTDRARTTRPAVTDEVRTGLYFVDAIFWDAVPAVGADLDQALREHYPGMTAPGGRLTMASWIGGDRDGNPSVLATVTAETLRLHRGLAVERHRRSPRELAPRLSISSERCPPPPALLRWLDSRRPLPERMRYLEARYANEPYRLVLSVLAADLEAASQEDMTSRLLDEAPHRAHLPSDETRKVLALVAAATPSVPAARALQTLRAQLESFGLHAARVDIREDSGRIAMALGEILAGLGIDEDFARRDEPMRRRLLLDRLAAETPAPSQVAAAASGETSGETSGEVWRLLRLISRVQSVYGRECLGPFIISMTRGPADLLSVLLLARWAGGEAGLQIVPLFETLDDLDAAPRILEELLALPVYRAHLET